MTSSAGRSQTGSASSPRISFLATDLQMKPMPLSVRRVVSSLMLEAKVIDFNTVNRLLLEVVPDPSRDIHSVLAQLTSFQQILLPDEIPNLLLRDQGYELVKIRSRICTKPTSDRNDWSVGSELVKGSVLRRIGRCGPFVPSIRLLQQAYNRRSDLFCAE